MKFKEICKTDTKYNLKSFKAQEHIKKYLLKQEGGQEGFQRRI